MTNGELVDYVATNYDWYLTGSPAGNRDGAIAQLWSKTIRDNYPENDSDKFKRIFNFIAGDCDYGAI